MGSTGLIDRVQLATTGFQASSTPQQVAPVTFTRATGLDAAKGIALCVFPAPNAPTGYVGTQSGGTQNPADMTFSTCTGGINWTAPATNRDMLLEVKGTITTP
jgi:hypothetical protein